MPSDHERHRSVLRAVVLAAVLAVVLAAVTTSAAVSSALASPASTAVTVAPSGLVAVPLAAHEYGRLAAPETVVAVAGPQLFTFTPGLQSATTGPNTFD